MIIIRRANYRSTPWKNGGGITHEALRMPAAGESFRWRVSVAEVATSGPFSDFSGYRRHMVLLRGAGVRLRFGDGGEAVLSAAGDRVEFDGGMATDCDLLAGPCTDLNLMVEKTIAAVRAEVLELGGSGELEPPAGAAQLVFTITGRVAVTDGGRVREVLEPWDLAYHAAADASIERIAAVAGSGAARVFVASLSDQ